MLRFNYTEHYILKSNTMHYLTQCAQKIQSNTSVYNVGVYSEGTQLMMTLTSA